MADFTHTVSVPEWQREMMAREFETTYHLAFGTNELVDMRFFSATLEAVQRTDPVPVALRDLIGQLRAGGKLQLSVRWQNRSERVQFSELLRQSARRPARDGGQAEVAAALSELCREFDRQQRVTQDEDERAWQAGEAARAREARERQAEARERVRVESERAREADRRSMLVPDWDEV